MWVINRDSFNTLEGVELFKVANLLLNESEFENINFKDNKEADVDDVEVNEVWTIKD